MTSSFSFEIMPVILGRVRVVSEDGATSEPLTDEIMSRVFREEVSDFSSKLYSEYRSGIKEIFELQFPNYGEYEIRISFSAVVSAVRDFIALPGFSRK